MAGIDNNTLFYSRGDSFTDLSLTPKTITNSNAVIVDAGKFGKCFDTNNGCLTSSLLIPSTADFTIDFWFKQLALKNSAIFRANVSGTIGYYGGVGINTLVDGTVALLMSYNGTSWAINENCGSVNINEWNHISIIRSAGNVSVYINGVLKKQISISTNGLFQSSIFTIGRSQSTDTSTSLFNGYISDFRVSNIARWTTNFTPPTSPYNSLTINVTSQTTSNIDFNVSKLGAETINKVEVYINNTLSRTYTTGYDNLNYLIDNSLFIIGKNNIKIKVIYDINYSEEKILTYSYKPNPLPTNVGFKAKNDRDEALYNGLIANRDNLKTNLTNKGVDVTGVNEMSNLIDKVASIVLAPNIVAYDTGVDYTSLGNMLGAIQHTSTSGNPRIALSVKIPFSGSIRCKFLYYMYGGYETNASIKINGQVIQTFSNSTDANGGYKTSVSKDINVNKNDVVEILSWSTTGGKFSYIENIMLCCKFV